MRGRFAGFILFVGAALWPTWVSALTAGGHNSQHHCEIANPAKLPAAVGGASFICSEIERAVAAAAPTVRYSASVSVISSSRLSTVLVVNGRTLPDQNFAVMDRELNPESIRHFAEALANEVAKAARE